VSQPNYVKKVVFPLEILAWVTVTSALMHFLASLLLLILFCIATGISLTGGIFLVPLVMLPLILMTLGFTWLLASLGVYLRDIAQAVGVVTTVLLFLSPVFYKANAMPEKYQVILALNPLTLPIEQMRTVLLWGTSVDWSRWSVSLLEGIVVFCGGFWWFQRSRNGFADVL
jgi:lipopolysaccharide transport system permease protein